MNKIDIWKKYRTRSGLSVQILKTDLKSPNFPVVAIIQASDANEFCQGFTEYGKFYTHGESDMDLIEVSPYEDFKIDEPVMVRVYENEEWVRRHFAGVSTNGRAMAWDDGKTSWTNDLDANSACAI